MWRCAGRDERGKLLRPMWKNLDYNGGRRCRGVRSGIWKDGCGIRKRLMSTAQTPGRQNGRSTRRETRGRKACCLDLARLSLPPGFISDPQAYTPRISRCHILDAAVLHRCDLNRENHGATAQECAPTDKRTVTRASTLRSISSFGLVIPFGPQLSAAATTYKSNAPLQVACPAMSQCRLIWYGTEVDVATADPKQGTHSLNHIRGCWKTR